jgi:uncharacterized protein (DUF885 family)
MEPRPVLILTLLGVGLCAAASAPGPRPQAAPGPDPAFAAFVDEYAEALFAWSPSTATALGLHQYDARLEDRSAAAVAARVKTLQRLRRRLAAVARPGRLAPDEAIDAEALAGRIRGELLDLETVRTWRHNPMPYLLLPSFALSGLVKRDFAPPARRLRAVTARLRAVPGLLRAMRENVENPPRDFTQLSAQVARGALAFLRRPLADWAREAAGEDARLLQEFEDARRPAVRAVEEAADWLKGDLLPRSRGAFALGAENFQKKLLYEEMVDVPLDRLLAAGEANLRRDYDALVATARKIDPAKSPAQVMEALAADHPREDDLIPAARRTVEKVRHFVIDRDLVTVPSKVRPRVTATPPFFRVGGFASMDTPGAYEKRATEAFYYVTPPEPGWNARRKEEYLRAFHFPLLHLITIHEAFPGHYVQFLYAPRWPTKARKLMACYSNVEGWAHYTEQMVVDRGYGRGDPKIRLAQLQAALLRDCRFVVAVRLHARGMSVEEGARYFVDKAFLAPTPARLEARRGTFDPMYLCYTLGKLQILKLRDDYRRAKGRSFRLRAFHDEFLRQGALPIPLLRRILLPGDKGPAL